VKRYEGLFILNSAAREESLKEMIDKITAEITAAGGKVETIQKMDKKTFTRVADRKHTAGYYVNILFECEPAAVARLRHRFVNNEDVFRVLFTLAAAPKPAVIPAAGSPQ
jgi:ribosomal protein S6